MAQGTESCSLRLEIYKSGNRSRIENAHIVVETVLVAIGLLDAACNIQNHVENLGAHFGDGGFAGCHIAGRDVDHVEPVVLHLIAAAHLDDRGNVQAVGGAPPGHEHLQADAACHLAGYCSCSMPPTI